MSREETALFSEMQLAVRKAMPIEVAFELLESGDPRVRKDAAKLIGQMFQRLIAAATTTVEGGQVTSDEDAATHAEVQRLVREAAPAAFWTLVELALESPDPAVKRDARKKVAAILQGNIAMIDAQLARVAANC